MIDRLRTDISNLTTQLEEAAPQESKPAGVIQTSDAIETATAPSVFSDGASAPAQQQDGLGQTFEEFTENKIKDTYDKKTTVNFDGPERVKHNDTSTIYKDGNVTMPDNLSGLGSGGGTTIGELEGEWFLTDFGNIDQSDQGDWGSAYVKGSTKILDLSGQLYYNFDADWDKKTISAGVGAKGSIEIVGAHYEAGYSTPGIDFGEDSRIDLNSKVNLDAYVGVKGNIDLGITLGKENHLDVGAGGFDGTSASLAGKIGAGEMADVNGDIKAWAGIGAKAGFHIGFKDGKLDIDWGLGLALGAGLEWDLGFNVDFGEIADSGLDLIRVIGGNATADWIENTAGDIIAGAGDAANWFGNAVEDTGDAIANAADDAVDAGEDIVDQAGEAAGDAIDTAGDVIDTVTDW